LVVATYGFPLTIYLNTGKVADRTLPGGGCHARQHLVLSAQLEKLTGTELRDLNDDDS